MSAAEVSQTKTTQGEDFTKFDWFETCVRTLGLGGAFMVLGLFSDSEAARFFYFGLSTASIAWSLLTERYSSVRARKLEKTLTQQQEPLKKFYGKLSGPERQRLASNMLKDIAGSIHEARRLKSKVNEDNRIRIYNETEQFLKDLGLKVPNDFYYWDDHDIFE